MLMPISKLKFFPGNARRGDIDTIAESLQRLGQFAPVVVNKGTHAPEYANTLLSGNHTTMAAQRIGWTEIDVHMVDVDADTAKRIVLVANSSNDKATYDVEELVNLATELPDLEATGFTRDELDAMLEALEDNFGEDDTPPDDLPSGEETLTLLVECDNPNQRDTLKSKLLAEGYNVGNA